MKAATVSTLACTVVAAAVSIGSTSALAPRNTTPSSPETTAATMTRRSAALAVIGSSFAVASAPAFAKEEMTAEEKEFIEYQKEKMKKKIEASKANYRKTNDLVKQRKDTADYSCLDRDCSETAVVDAKEKK